MLAKKYKLPVQEFVGKTGRTTRSLQFIIKIFPSSLTNSRFGLVISKKVYPEAVKRNQLKRLVFHLIENIITKLAIQDYLIIFSPAVSRLTNKQLEHDLRNTLVSFIK